MRTSIIAIVVASCMFSCQRFAQNLNQGLEDEKSYTRHAMETYRKNPKVFRQNKSVLETWSRSDYVAVAVAMQKKPGRWAETSDKLTFLEPKLQHDVTGHPFCVIHLEDRIVVLSIRSAPVPACSLELLNGVDVDRINSGDMEFSGRADFWVYVLRAGQEKSSP